MTPTEEQVIAVVTDLIETGHVLAEPAEIAAELEVEPGEITPILEALAADGKLDSQPPAVAYWVESGGPTAEQFVNGYRPSLK